MFQATLRALDDVLPYENSNMLVLVSHPWGHLACMGLFYFMLYWFFLVSAHLAILELHPAKISIKKRWMGRGSFGPAL